MPVLIGILVVCVLAYLFYQMVIVPARNTTPQFARPSGRPAEDCGFAFVANGKLFYRQRGADLQQHHSAYAQESEDRRERSRARNGWKENTSFGIAASGGRRQFEPAEAPVQATSAVFDRDQRLLYFLRDEAVGGLFCCEPGSNAEQRILLKQHLYLGDLSLSPNGEHLSASSRKNDGVANIALMQSDGSQLREVTGGDTFDSAPAWIPGVENRLLFQSAGLARDAGGYVVAQGNSSIQMLDMESGSVSAILEDPRFDYIKPRVAPDGNLLFIRRPYELPRYNTSSFFLDTLLFPFRLLRALFHYLNFFSMMYSRKPLTSASGPAVQADMKSILLQGRRIDAEKALRSENQVQGVPSLVPRSWELVSRSQQGAERVLATNVASYDINPDGKVVYSNGRGVFVLGKEGDCALVLKTDLVSEVFAGRQ